MGKTKERILNNPNDDVSEVLIETYAITMENMGMFIQENQNLK